MQSGANSMRMYSIAKERLKSRSVCHASAKRCLEMSSDLRGVLRVKTDLEAFARDEPQFWAPEPIFDDLIKNGQGFGSLNGRTV